MYKSLTQKQIGKLFGFCLKNEIYEYDLQIEIVDHLASSIEEQWEKEPNLSFNRALKNGVKGFGKNGLQKIEQKLKKQLRKNFNRIMFNYFLEYFRWPKLTITVALFFLFFTALRISPNNFWILIFVTAPISAFSVYYYYFFFPKKLDIQDSEGKSFALLDYLKNINTKAGSVVQLPFLILMFSSETLLPYSNVLWQEAGMAAFFAILLVLLYGHFFFLPQKIREYFFKNYLETAQ
ncbi:hypothetical protein GM418_14440 [Maribellus comscasis]|uniref:Uncharacterized protein n=1 Tax=Maribellus comscasis TaxID=2681766 RepID=A0A6I6JXF7_9BACT|nr:hypothetical protein [Maribellus comscasis]QGY44822.1 hypothetical protein GM418_14440 [Maribellus comscasis]